MNRTNPKTLNQAIETAINYHIGLLNTCLPGQIEKYDSTQQKADVSILLKKKYKDGSIPAEKMVISAVPVVFPRTSKSMVHFPLAAGDGVLLVFAQRSLEDWLFKGGETVPTDPRKFDLTDAIAIPGLYDFKVATLAENNEDFLIVHNGEKIVIKKDGNIEIGAASLKKLVNEEFKTLFNNHVHNCTGPIGPITTSTPAALTGTLLPPPPIPGPPFNGTEITDLQLTVKTKAE
jgi:hypothetical protein